MIVKNLHQYCHCYNLCVNCNLMLAFDLFCYLLSIQLVYTYCIIKAPYRPYSNAQSWNQTGSETKQCLSQLTSTHTFNHIQLPNYSCCSLPEYKCSMTNNTSHKKFSLMKRSACRDGSLKKQPNQIHNTFTPSLHLVPFCHHKTNIPCVC